MDAWIVGDSKRGKGKMSIPVDEKKPRRRWIAGTKAPERSNIPYLHTLYPLSELAT